MEPIGLIGPIGPIWRIALSCLEQPRPSDLGKYPKRTALKRRPTGDVQTPGGVACNAPSTTKSLAASENPTTMVDKTFEPDLAEARFFPLSET